MSDHRDWRRPGLLRRRTFVCAALALASPAVHAQGGGWPNRIVRLVVPYPPGGASDIVARNVAERLPAKLGQQIVIEHKAGAGGAVGGEYVARAAPDGYTLLANTTGLLTINPHLSKTPYDPLKDFTPISTTAASYGMLGVHPSVPVGSLQDLIAYAKAHPGKLHFGSAGNGTITQLYGEIFKLDAGIDIVHVPYRGSGPALNDLLAGQIQMMFDPVTMPHIKAGRLKGLATVGEKRWSGLPEVPTLKEQGFSGRVALSWFGIIGPAGLPADMVDRMAAAVGEVLRDPDLTKRLDDLGFETMIVARDDMRRRIAEDHALFGDVIRRAKISIQ
jgi:tripartite-type tricarboxylate transporter receptor subunit TctC